MCVETEAQKISVTYTKHTAKAVASEKPNIFSSYTINRHIKPIYIKEDKIINVWLRFARYLKCLSTGLDWERDRSFSSIGETVN